MIRSYGTSADPFDTSTNTIIQQSGGTNYPSMVADINSHGPATVRYIHWTSTVSFHVEEILCYKAKRLYSDQFEDSVNYIQAKNGYIDTSNCETLGSGKTTLDYNDSHEAYASKALQTDCKEAQMVKIRN